MWNLYILIIILIVLYDLLSYDSFRCENYFSVSKNNKSLIMYKQIPIIPFIAHKYLLKAFFMRQNYSNDVLSNFKYKYDNYYNKTQMGDLSIGFVGDILPVPNKWKPHSNINKIMDRIDCWIGNLETPLTFKEIDVSSQHQFSIDFLTNHKLLTKFDDYRSINRFKFLSVANNHSLDKGEDGLKETLKVLDAKNIIPIGVKNNYIIQTLNGIKIGMYGLTFYSNKPINNTSLEYYDYLYKGDSELLDKIRNFVSVCSGEQCDIKILSLHWGYEYEYYPDIKQIDLAHKIVAEGIDILFGHHPHVYQPYEIVSLNNYDTSILNINTSDLRKRKALILYSMGNFAFNAINDRTNYGKIIIINFMKQIGRVDFHISELIDIYNTKRGNIVLSD